MLWPLLPLPIWILKKNHSRCFSCCRARLILTLYKWEWQNVCATLKSTHTYIRIKFYHHVRHDKISYIIYIRRCCFAIISVPSLCYCMKAHLRCVFLHLKAMVRCKCYAKSNQQKLLPRSMARSIFQRFRMLFRKRKEIVSMHTHTHTHSTKTQMYKTKEHIMWSQRSSYNLDNYSARIYVVKVQYGKESVHCSNAEINETTHRILYCEKPQHTQNKTTSKPSYHNYNKIVEHFVENISR